MKTVIEINGREVEVDSQVADAFYRLEAKVINAAAAFEKLACLGNGDRHGNSLGTAIAKRALTELAS